MSQVLEFRKGGSGGGTPGGRMGGGGGGGIPPEHVNAYIDAKMDSAVALIKLDIAKGLPSKTDFYAGFGLVIATVFACAGLIFGIVQHGATQMQNGIQTASAFDAQFAYLRQQIQDIKKK